MTQNLNKIIESIESAYIVTGRGRGGDLALEAIKSNTDLLAGSYYFDVQRGDCTVSLRLSDHTPGVNGGCEVNAYYDCEPAELILNRIHQLFSDIHEEDGSCCE